jgi:hypothetical protein
MVPTRGSISGTVAMGTIVQLQTVAGPWSFPDHGVAASETRSAREKTSHRQLTRRNSYTGPQATFPLNVPFGGDMVFQGSRGTTTANQILERLTQFPHAVPAQDNLKYLLHSAEWMNQDPWRRPLEWCRNRRCRQPNLSTNLVRTVGSIVQSRSRLMPLTLRPTLTAFQRDASALLVIIHHLPSMDADRAGNWATHGNSIFDGDKPIYLPWRRVTRYPVWSPAEPPSTISLTSPASPPRG